MSPQSHSLPPSLSPSSTANLGVLNHQGNNQPDLSMSQLLKGKLCLHGELIDALRELASQSNAGDLSKSSGRETREMVLEQALVEQNQILDVLQELVSNLESENKRYRESLSSQGMVIHSLSGWETKAKQAEQGLMELRKGVQVSPMAKNGLIADLKKRLEEKNQTILLLQSKLSNEGGDVESLLTAKLSSARAKLEVERVNCIELEEKLSQIKDEIVLVKRKSAENESKMIGKESEILHLRHEMEIMRNFEQQQQDVVMKQRASLAGKNVQLSSLTRALNKQKKVADQLRRIQLNSSVSYSLLPRVGDSGSSDLQIQASLFEQVLGRETCTVELTRITEETELGFSFTKVDLPVSSRGVPCLVVKMVQEGSKASGWLFPGDELIEVNRILCRSSQQSRAIRALEGLGVLKIVVARENLGPSSASKLFGHSTPTRRPGLADKANKANSNDRTAMWATGVYPKGATLESFSTESMLSDPDENTNPEYITVPELYAISVTKDSEGSLNGGDQPQANTSDSSSQQKPAVEHLSSSVSSTNESESLTTADSKEAASRRKFQNEIVELQDQLDESEQIRLNLESELNSTRDEAAHLKNDFELTKAEYHELQQQQSSYESELTEVRQYVSDLQKALITLEAQVNDEQQKLFSMENLNRIVSSELAEAKETTTRAVEVRAGLVQEAQQLKTKLEEKEQKEKETKEELQQLRLNNARLKSDLSRMGGEMNALRTSLENCKKSSEEAIDSLKQQSKQLESQLAAAKEISEKTTVSSREEYEHLTSQLKSAKSLLMEGEMKESKQKVEMRYLKQAADLANAQLKNLETDHQKTKDELGLFKQQAENKTLEMESVTVNLKGTRMNLEAKQEMISRLQGDVDHLRRISSKLRNENSQLKESLKRLKVDLKTSRFEEERLEEKLDASAIEKDEMFQQLEKSFEESTDFSMTIERLTVQVRELEDAEQKQVEMETDGKKTIEDEMKSLKDSEAKLKHELEVSQKRVELMAQQMPKVKNEVKLLEGKHAMAAKELTQARAENEQLAAARDDLKQQLAELQESHTKMAEEMDKGRIEIDGAKSTLLNTQEQAKIEKRHLDEAKNKLSDLVLELEKTKEAKKQSKDMIASLEFIQAQNQNKLEEMKLAVDGKVKEVQRLNDQIEGLNSLLQKTKVEQTNLTTSNASTRKQLEDIQRIHAEEVKGLKDKLMVKEKKLVHLNDEFKAQEAVNEILQSKTEHLSESLEQESNKKHFTEIAMQESLKKKDEVKARNKQLEAQIARLRVELDQLFASNDSLSSETAALRQQLRQNEKEMDQLTAQLHAVEMNLEVTTRALRESERVNSAQSEKLEDLEYQYRNSQSNLEDLSAKLEASSMEVFKKEDEISKLRAGLELRQVECKQLHESLITLHASAENLQRKVSELESEKSQLVLRSTQLDEDRRNLQDSLMKLEEAKDNELRQQSDEIEEYQKEIQQLQLRGKAHLEEIAGLNISGQEAKGTISQLLSAQEEMKKSISKHGDEKDTEILKLQKEVEGMASKLDTATVRISSYLENEENLKEQMLKLEEKRHELQEQLKQETSSNSELKEEILMYKATKDKITELNEKVTVLDESLKEKTRKLSERESISHAMELELTNMKSENENLLEKAFELSELKLSLAELSEAKDDLHKQLEEKEISHAQVLAERNSLLSRVREFEVHEHASKKGKNSTSIVEPAGTRVNDTDQLLQLLEKKDEEVSRTKEFSENLLLNVMMKAPFLLEKL